jgi:hypothetical protein
MTMKKLLALALFTGLVASCVASKAPPLPSLGTTCGGYCGAERWLVKTLSDPDRECVSLKPVDATVEELVAFSPPAHLPRDTRVRPVECTVYRVEAYLAGWDRLMRDENDGDYHVVLFGLVNQRASLIAEIPSPDCAGACRSGLSQDYAAARAVLEAGVRRPNPRDLPIRVRVIGVGFFDRAHGQIGRAPNGFELHPVLSIEFLPLEP